MVKTAGCCLNLVLPEVSYSPLLAKCLLTYDCVVSITELILLNCDASHFIFYYTVRSAHFKEL